MTFFRVLLLRLQKKKKKKDVVYETLKICEKRSIFFPLSFADLLWTSSCPFVCRLTTKKKREKEMQFLGVHTKPHHRKEEAAFKR